MIFQQKNRLKNLTPSEQEILKEYIINKTYTQTLQVTNGVVVGMENDGIIQRVGKIPNDDEWGFDFNINKWVWEYLNNHPELIEAADHKQYNNSLEPTGTIDSLSDRLE